MKFKAILTSLAALSLITGCEKKPSVEKAAEHAKEAAESAKEAAKDAAQSASDAVKSALHSGDAFVRENPEAKALKRAVDTYEKENTPPNEAAVDQAITDTNGKIAELQEKAARATGDAKEEAAAQVKSLTEFRNEETARFAKAQARPTPSEPQTNLQKFEENARKTGDALKDAAKETADAAGDKLKEAKEHAGDALKRAGEALKKDD